MIRRRWNAHYCLRLLGFTGPLLGALGAAGGCVDVLGIDTDRPYVAPPDGSLAEASVDSQARDSTGPDSTGEDADAGSPETSSTEDGALEGATADAIEENTPEDADATADAGIMDATSEETGPGSIKPGPPCLAPDGAVPREPFAASPYLVGPSPTFAAPPSGCGNDVAFGTASVGQVEAENYDVGGQNISYFDTTPGNFYGQYRGEDVDIEWGMCGIFCADVNHIAKGEWSEYTIQVAQSYSYAITLSYSASLREFMHIDLDGSNVSGTLTVAATTTPGQPLQYFFKVQPTFVTVCLPAGKHVLRFNFDGPDDNAMALDFVSFQPMNAATCQPLDAGP